MSFALLASSVSDALRAQAPHASNAEQLPPDVVLIISDDQAWNDYSFMGHKQINTPNIDQMARESILFTRGYVPDSLCRPSLASIASGLYPHQHGIVGNDPPPLQLEPSIGKGAGRGRKYRDPEYQKQIKRYQDINFAPVQTIPERLASLNYLSLQTGKWWEGNPKDHGFERAMTHGDPNRGGRHGDLGLKVGRSTMKPIEGAIKDAVAKNRPYFIWYAPFLPHTPHTPPKELLEQAKKKTDSLPLAKYWAMCEWFDQTVGQLRSLVESHGRPDNTIYLYVCDNGWINQRNASRYAPRSKRSRFDGGIRTPIFVHMPSRFQAQRDDQHLASSIDLLPTILDVVGLPKDKELPGVSLIDSEAIANRNAIYGAIYEHDVQSLTVPAKSLRYRWVIDGNWKYIEPYHSRIPDAEAELFDLITDPFEKQNLAMPQAMKASSLLQQLNAWWNPKTTN